MIWWPRRRYAGSIAGTTPTAAYLRPGASSQAFSKCRPAALRVASSDMSSTSVIPHPSFTGEAGVGDHTRARHVRSEEHTSELQSLRHLVCRLLLEKKKLRADPIMA